MANEKKYTNEELKAALENERMSEAELDNVAGGNANESYADMMYLNQYCGIGFNPNNWDASVNKLGELYRRAGTIFQAHNKDEHANFYADGFGRPVGRNTALYDLACKINNGQIHIEDIRYLC